MEQPKSELDYRLVGILPALSRLFKRLVAPQVTVCIESLTLSNENMSAFRQSHSTITAPLGIRDEIICSLRRGDFNGSRRRHLIRLILDKSK